MIYQHIDRELFEFISNPIKNRCYLTERPASLSIAARILYNVPFLRKFINDKDAMAIFERRYAAYLTEASAATQSLAPGHHDVRDEKYISVIMNNFTRFFKIGVLFANDDDFSQADKKLANGHITANLLTKLEYHCNRITEAFDLSDDYLHSISANEKLWISFFLSEVYLLLKCNIFTLNLNGNDIFIESGEEFKQKVRGYWISEILEANSKTSDIKAFIDLASALTRRKTLPADLANASIDYILDKVFSINPNYITPAVSANEKYQFLREVIFFSLILECNFLSGSHAVDRQYFLNSKHIRDKSLQFIEQHLLPASDARLNNEGGFICQSGDSGYKRAGLSFKYGLRKFCGMLLQAQQDNLKGKDFKGELGDFFEVDYILNYLKKLNYFGYTPHAGFKSTNKSEIKGYDVDIVLHDSRNDIYYFIQVKYRFSALPTYFSEQFMFFNEDSFKKGYVNQLITLKDNFSHQSIRNQLRSRGLAAATLENSHFILLHNIPFLNFYEHQGVYFYEWNLLRNILQDGKIHWRKGDEMGNETTSNTLQLHKPEEIIDAFLNNSINGQQLQQQFELFKNSKCLFRFGKENVRCQML
ncbi:hypothetical protein N5923_21455 [Erwiniaceae bacterium BAC15a-03b]|uniref:Uncharacterized protein n=1 Tax=Winslowiella arboricola TaxID=2978220 RepID=A0A9J6PWH0_9GAMM|nr:hypothetical protein [Winslowiella arboricola]MCU5774787.1 hypothetical protein [Winslowiella arboricola]MCU5780061.1 hypothetical protein [Winslowiella arboricola]